MIKDKIYIEDKISIFDIAQLESGVKYLKELTNKFVVLHHHTQDGKKIYDNYKTILSYLNRISTLNKDNENLLLTTYIGFEDNIWKHI